MTYIERLDAKARIAKSCPLLIILTGLRKRPEEEESADRCPSIDSIRETVCLDVIT